MIRFWQAFLFLTAAAVVILVLGFPVSANTGAKGDPGIKTPLYNETHPFSIRIVGIFVADSELPYTLELAKPSINIALQKAKEVFGRTTRWENAVFRNGSSHCTSNYAGVFAAEEFYLRRVTVFIGPSCGLALDPVARMAAYWRIPVISSGGPHVKFSNKTIFSTLTRLSFSLTNLGSFVSQLFDKFRWRHMAIIMQETSSSPLIPLIKETIVDVFDSNTEIIIDVHEISRSLAKTNLKNLLVECAKESRIMLILTSGDTLRHILLSAYDLGLGSGAYVFLTVELFKHANSFGNFDWFIPGDARNDDVKFMYQSLMVLAVHVPMTDFYHRFAEDVIQESRNEFNTSFTTDDVNVILAGFHDSVMMYGHAVADTIAAGRDPMDGREVTARLWNRTFSSYLSGDVYINANGDRETDYTLKDFDPERLEMRPVIIYSGQQDQIVWSNMSAIHWQSGWIPLSDVTFCHDEIPDLFCNNNNLNSKIFYPSTSGTWPLMDILLAVGIVLLIILVMVVYVYRRMRLESKLTSLWWKVRWNEIIFIQNQSDRSLDASKPTMFSTFVTAPMTATESTEVTGTAVTIVAAPVSPLPPALPPPTVIEHPFSPAKSNSAPQTLTHELDPKKTTTAVATTGNAPTRTKPHIRINDFFTIPNYLQNLGSGRTPRPSSNNIQLMKQGTSNSLEMERSNTLPSGTKTNDALLLPGCHLFHQDHQHPHHHHHHQHHNQHRGKCGADMFTPMPNKGVYKGSKVFIKHLNIKHLSINREILIELKQLKDLAHENLVRFVGVCAEDQHISILTEYCEKGNLRDLLDNEAIRIDWPFRYSLINDIVEGMLFIHESSLGYHGSLKSLNCVIDSRLVVKLTDIGLKTLRNLSKQNSGPPNYKSYLWTAPEHLRQRRPDLHGSPKGDIYSFSIVLQEIITRSGPFETVRVVGGDGKYSVVSLDPQFIIQQLRLGGATPYRPNVDQTECGPELIELLMQCWDENPNNRPTFSAIRAQIRKISKDFVGGSGTSFLENLLLRLEQYANDLEILVEQKTSAFFEEKRKCEELLYELLPKTVADQLKRGNQVKPESYQCVTIFFSDIVQFTRLAAASTPIQIVDFLNDLYTLFDSIIASYDVYKVETVGDAYMVVSGLPVRNGNEHARQIARMSLELLDQIKKFKIKHLPDQEVQLRIGLHSGPCAAGVIGLKMPRYCLFGDTVNTASRMESHGEPNKIHTSETTKNILDWFGTFELTLRGDIYLKGKGIVRTYWLDRERFSERYRGFMQMSSKLAQQQNQLNSSAGNIHHRYQQPRKSESLDFIEDQQEPLSPGSSLPPHGPDSAGTAAEMSSAESRIAGGGGLHLKSSSLNSIPVAKATP